MAKAPKKEIKTCGLIMPISSFGGHDQSHWSDVKDIIERAIEKLGLQCKPVWENGQIDIIHGRIIRNLYEEDMIVCDASALNPNVMFELGIRIAFKRPIILIADDETKIPFDTGLIHHLIYPSNLYFREIEEFIQVLSSRITEVMETVSANKYEPFLDSLGAFRTFEPKERSVDLENYMVDKIDTMSLRLSRIEELSKIERKKANESSIGWTEARIQTLKAMWENGATASQIGEELNVNRNVIIGKAHRLGLKSRPSPIKLNGLRPTT